MTTLLDLLTHRAQLQPDRIAFTFLKDGERDAESFSYAELHQAACRLAVQLQALNLGGERALILHPPGFDYLSALFGCWYAGVVAVPAYPPRNWRNAERIQNIALDAEVAVVLTAENHLENTRHWLGEALNVATLLWLTPQETDQNNPENHQFTDPILLMICVWIKLLLNNENVLISAVGALL